MTDMAQHAVELRALKAQGEKILGEVGSAADSLRQQINDLEDQLAAGGATTAEVDEATAGLHDVLDRLDNLNPDAAAPSN